MCRVTPLTARSDDILARIISTVASTLELDDVLRAVVRLLSDASAVHACFVYLVEGDQLVLRAAGEMISARISSLRAVSGVTRHIVERPPIRRRSG